MGNFDEALLGIPDDLLRSAGIDDQLIIYLHNEIDSGAGGKTEYDAINVLVQKLLNMINRAGVIQKTTYCNNLKRDNYAFNGNSFFNDGTYSFNIKNIFTLVSILIVQLRYLLTNQKPSLSVAEGNEKDGYKERVFTFEELLSKSKELKNKRIFLSQSYSQAVKLSSQISKIATNESSDTAFNMSSINKLYSTLIHLATDKEGGVRRPACLVMSKGSDVYYYQKNRPESSLIFIRYHDGKNRNITFHAFMGADKYGFDVENLKGDHKLIGGLKHFKTIPVGGSYGWFYQYFQQLVKNHQFGLLRQIYFEAEKGSLKTFLSLPTTRQDNIPASKVFDVTTPTETISMKAGYKKKSMTWMTWNDAYKTLLEIKNSFDAANTGTTNMAQEFAKIFVEDAKLNKDVGNIAKKNINEMIKELQKTNYF